MNFLPSPHESLVQVSSPPEIALGTELSQLRVTVIGGGLMGHGIAGLHAAAGARVTILETDPGSRETAHQRLHDSFAPLGTADAAVGNTQVTADSRTALTGSDLVIEAAHESIEVKHRLLALASEHAPQAIFASNTSAIRISDIASSHVNPSRVVGTHFFNPPHLVPLVEVVPGVETSEQTILSIAGHLRALGKIPAVLSSDPPGFVANRIQHAMWREALALLDEGVADAETIDLIVRNSFGPRLTVMGPIENADFVGLDLTAAIHDYLFPHLSTMPHASHLVTQAVHRGDLGRKTGRGLGDWPADRAERATAALNQHLIDTFSLGKA